MRVMDRGERKAFSEISDVQQPCPQGSIFGGPPGHAFREERKLTCYRGRSGVPRAC